MGSGCGRIELDTVPRRFARYSWTTLKRLGGE